MPTDNQNGFGAPETDATATNNSSSASPASSASDSPAPRRRRTGRRVVRAAGAAGSALPMHVQEPQFEEPAIEGRSARARRRAAAQDSPDTNAENRHERALEAVGELSFIRGAAASASGSSTSAGASAAVSAGLAALAGSARRSGRPMTSLLFQEPVLPTRHAAASASVSADDARDEDDDESREAVRRPRRRRLPAAEDLGIELPEPRDVRRSRAARDDGDERDDESRDSRDSRDSHEEGATRTRRRTRSRSAVRDESRDESRDEAAEEQPRVRERRAARDEEYDPDNDTRRSRRSRRLNAQERRAAAEVEQIEQDLEYDDITYAPIDVDESVSAEESGASSEAAEDRKAGEGSSDESGETTTRRRRRRRSGHDADAADAGSDRSDRDRDRASSEDDEDEDSGVTRRRRRRRGSRAAEDEDDAPLVRRSRKQQYIDEITDIEGSTRLEAKKQRRRDNRRERSRQSQLMEQDFLARREHVNRLMVVREREHHTQISVIEDNVLVEHYVSDIQEVATVGNIYLGRVQNVLPSMEAAFVDIGQTRNGVLYAGEVNWDAARLDGQPRRIELAFKSGDPVLVQVTKDPIGHKGARLTSQITLAGRFLVLVPSGGMTGVSRKLSERERSRLKSIVSKIAPKDMGVIIRTAAEGASEEAITKDLENLVKQWERINAKREEFWHGKRPKLLQGEPDVAIRVVRDIFNDDFNKLIVEGDHVYARIEEYLDTMAPDLRDKLEKWDPAEHEGKDVFDKWQIDGQLRKGMERQVYLPSGGSLVIDRTEAMTTIDVNTGRFIGKGKSLEETVTRCNLEASEEIARQLRLRDIGGMVMIDYVDMVMPANRDLVLRRLVECLARDRTKHQVAEVTSLGLVQMTRKRVGQGLVEAFSEECPTCKGRGFILHDEPTVSASYDDPYALKGGDPFIKTNKHGRGTTAPKEPAAPQGSSADVKAKLAQIAAAAVAANRAEDEE
ncbi:Rne/Rng family ribonuclease [Bifidobacterium avesanii]|uniref:Ribonuclease E n=1 Tax=Bifidobacterium avesanii TaxID=1798157 RepID=A0A7K3TIR7_9BIFI|nr:Rne/Rng family ribonuclease [Bifidobacterium avesanii]KAB8290344.1 ribonuclease G [Bifidobacterium avesanii]NEG78982.1 Rne/Rng family ribonuclease [Bifidobacterium avesanii]